MSVSYYHILFMAYYTLLLCNKMILGLRVSVARAPGADLLRAVDAVVARLADALAHVAEPRESIEVRIVRRVV